MIILIQVDSHLHTPMYFFIKHLAFIDLGNSTVICPEMLVNFVVDQNTISYHSCATQLAFFLMFIISEFFILSAMTYDCYLAICNPLLYNVLMSQRLCHVLVGIPYFYSTFQALMFTIKIFTLTYCGSNVISHFSCDDVPLLLMLCSNAQEIELLVILYSFLIKGKVRRGKRPPSSFLNRHQTSIISSSSTLGGGSFLVPTWSYWDCHGAVEMGQKVVTY
ncbi:olfactory receptor 8K5-like [Megaptera novaeangliae]